METRLVFLLTLAVHTCCHADKTVALIEKWRLAEGHTHLPLTEVAADCNNGRLVTLRLNNNLNERDDRKDDYYVLSGNNCSAAKVKPLLDELQQRTANCYRSTDCGRVDLRPYFSKLIGLECRLCRRSGCFLATMDMLITTVVFTMEVTCKVMLEVNELSTFTTLNETGLTELDRNELPISKCKDGLSLERLIFTSSSFKSLVPTPTYKQNLSQLRSTINSCLSDPNCQSVDILLPGEGNSEVEDATSHRLGLFWSCKTMNDTNVLGLTAQGQAFRSALIVVSLLLTCSLVALGVLAFMVVRLKRSGAKARTPYDSQKSNYRRSLPKYQNATQHHLEEHRYSNLKLPKQTSEELYEYVDADEHVPDKTLGQERDSEGYVVPQP